MCACVDNLYLTFPVVLISFSKSLYIFQCVTPTPLYHFRTNGLREELSALSKLREARVEEEEEEKEELHGRKLQQEEMAKRARELAELCVTPVPLLPPVIGR